MHKRLLIISVLLLIAAVVLAGCEFNYDYYVIGCNGITVYGIDAVATVANYDADGDGIPDSEAYWVYGVDGAGNVLLDSFGGRDSIGSSWTDQDDSWGWNSMPKYNPITVQYITRANGFLPEDIVIATFTGECDGLPWATGDTFQDGRINRYDAGAPVAIYPYSFGERGMGLRIYAIQDDSEGLLIMEVTPEELAAASGEWELIVANAEYGVQVFKYGDQWQINARADQGKTYVVIFNELRANAKVNSYTTDPQ